MPLTEIDPNQLPVESKENNRKRRRSDSALLHKPKAVKLDDNDSNGDTVDTETHWRKLFMNLQQERVTAAERNLYLFMQESEKREETLKNYIHHLESDLGKQKEALELSEQQTKQVSELQERIDELVNQQQVADKSLEAAATQLEEYKESDKAQQSDLDQQDAEISMYKLLTGTTVHWNGKSEEPMECCVTNPTSKVSTKFQLCKSDDPKMMKFVPVENVKPLPDFLHQAIEFETDECPALMQNILKGVFPEEE